MLSRDFQSMADFHPGRPLLENTVLPGVTITLMTNEGLRSLHKPLILKLEINVAQARVSLCKPAIYSCRSLSSMILIQGFHSTAKNKVC